MVKGGDGHTEDYIEIVHFISPEGVPVGVGYRAHYFRNEYKTGKPYETLWDWTNIEHIEGLRRIALREDYSPLPVKDLGTTETGAPKDAGLKIIGL